MQPTMFSKIPPHARRGLAAPRRWMLGHPKPTRYLIPWPTAPEIVRPLASSALLCQLAPAAPPVSARRDVAPNDEYATPTPRTRTGVSRTWRGHI